MNADGGFRDQGRVGAIVLAAGQSSRLGTSKQLLKIDGQSLIRRAAKAALESCCSDVVVVTGASAELVAAELRELPVDVTFNPAWARGMGTSIRCGVREVAGSNLEGIVIALCDQPHLNSDVISSLIRLWQSSGKPVAACRYANTLGTPCCFGRSMFRALASLGEAQGAKALLQRDPADVAILDWPDGAVDIDTPEDWRRLWPHSL